MTTKAQAEKQKGNDAFKTGDFPTAIGHYTSAILSDPTDPTYPLNRAAAYLKLGKHADAERDCTKVIKLDPRNVKAWFRRAQARMALGQLLDAESDIDHLLGLDNDNQEANREKQVLQELRKSEKKRPSKPLIEVPVPLPPQPQPTPKRRRVPITIVEYPSQTQTSSPTLASDIKINPEKGPKSEQLTPVSNGTHKSKPETTPSPKPPLSTPTTVASSYVPTDAPGQTQISQPRGGIFRPSGKHTLFPLADNTKTQPTPPSQPPLLSTHSHQQSQRFSPTQPATHIPTSPPPLVSIPVRNQELNAIRRTWHTLPNPEAQWNSFKVIPPHALPTLFQQSLDPELLIKLLEVFRWILVPSAPPETRTLIKSYLQALPTVPRWKAIILFLSPEEQKLVADVWQLVDETQRDDKSREEWGLR